MRTETFQGKLKSKLLNTMLFLGSFPKLLLFFFLCYVNKVNPSLASLDIFCVFLSYFL